MPLVWTSAPIPPIETFGIAPTGLVRRIRLADGRLGARLTSSERWLRAELGRIDVVLAGPPCQGFSALNNHTRGRDPKNRLYEHVARVAEVLEPEHLLIENVASVRSYSPAAVRRTGERLATLGYHVRDAVVPVVDLGVPQLRRRHVLVATMGSALEPAEIFRTFRRPPRDLRWAI